MSSSIPLTKLPRSVSLKAGWASKMRKVGSHSPQARRQLPRRAWLRRIEITPRDQVHGRLLSADDVGAPRRRCDNRPHGLQSMAGLASRRLRRHRSGDQRHLFDGTAERRFPRLSRRHSHLSWPGRRGAPVARPERQARSDLAARPGAARHSGGREKPAATVGTVGDAAVTLAPASPAARIAQSYALQSGLRLEEARSALLAATPPDDPLVQARLAEVEFYLGNIGAARSAAERAIAPAPGLSRPRSILGFVDLAQFRFAAAEDAFRAAATLDPADPLPRLGLGLTQIRRGRLAEGTKELETAVALNPSSSILRSYLGKVYAADWRYDPAFREWGLAQQLDPKDPTPWLYQALANRSLNRPGDALADVQKSIELNDNRAVYRSRLLLDQDLATRGADLAGIYRDWL